MHCDTHSVMHPVEQIEAMELALSRQGISVAQLCRQADVAQTTWVRWKSQATSPSPKAWSKVITVFNLLCPCDAIALDRAA